MDSSPSPPSVPSFLLSHPFCFAVSSEAHPLQPKGKRKKFIHAVAVGPSKHTQMCFTGFLGGSSKFNTMGQNFFHCLGSSNVIFGHLLMQSAFVECRDLVWRFLIWYKWVLSSSHPSFPANVYKRKFKTVTAASYWVLYIFFLCMAYFFLGRELFCYLGFLNLGSWPGCAGEERGARWRRREEDGERELGSELAKGGWAGRGRGGE